MFPFLGSGGILLLDNASTHKAFIESLEGMDSTDVFTWIAENGDETSKAFLKAHEKRAFANDREERTALMEHVRERQLRVRKLAAAAAKANVQLRFLPPYWPECNAIERVWCYLKKCYEDISPVGKTWDERLRLAYEKITPEFVEKCIQRSLVWCHKKLEFLKAQENLAKGPPDLAATFIKDEDLMDDFDPEL